jgi:hypothetical protein
MSGPEDGRDTFSYGQFTYGLHDVTSQNSAAFIDIFFRNVLDEKLSIFNMCTVVVGVCRVYRLHSESVLKMFLFLAAS